MRKIILFMHLSLDGMMDGPKGSLAWTNMSEDSISRFMIPDLLKTTDAVLIGRKLYEGFQQFSFGRSTDKDGWSANRDLLRFKARFGAGLAAQFHIEVPLDRLIESGM